MNREQQKLLDWLEEYALWMPEDEQTAPETEGEPIDFSDQPTPGDGHIRLWPSPDGLLYGLVLLAGYGRWKVLPFSPLHVPAVPGEVRVREHGPVQVLEGWNLRIVSASVVRNSWYADALEETERFWLQDWVALLEEGGEMPERFRDRTGPRLLHPEDPRHVYLDQQAERADRCLGESWAASEGIPPAQAAEESGSYGKKDPENGDPEDL